MSGSFVYGVCNFFVSKGDLKKTRFDEQVDNQTDNPIMKKPSDIKTEGFCTFRDPAGTRTQDPNIKSVMLYRLSYRINLYVSVKVVQI